MHELGQLEVSHPFEIQDMCEKIYEESPIKQWCPKSHLYFDNFRSGQWHCQTFARQLIAELELNVLEGVAVMGDDHPHIVSVAVDIISKKAQASGENPHLAHIDEAAVASLNDSGKISPTIK